LPILSTRRSNRLPAFFAFAVSTTISSGLASTESFCASTISSSSRITSLAAPAFLLSLAGFGLTSTFSFAFKFAIITLASDNLV
jgi:hypothetical protein